MKKMFFLMVSLITIFLISCRNDTEGNSKPKEIKWYLNSFSENVNGSISTNSLTECQRKTYIQYTENKIPNAIYRDYSDCDNSIEYNCNYNREGKKFLVFDTNKNIEYVAEESGDRLILTNTKTEGNMVIKTTIEFKKAY